MFTKRTDLAMEAQELQSENKIDGVEVEKEDYHDIFVTRVKVKNENGQAVIGKPIGNYITIESPHLRGRDSQLFDKMSQIVKNELFLLHEFKREETVLVVGLGNWNITPDSLGPKVVSMTLVSRHLKEHIPDQIDQRMGTVSAIAPGVLGLTGIETGEIVKGVVDKIKPSLVIVVDALASLKLERVSTTIQIADTGISPGSGVGNTRKALNRETLGTDVIAVGVPTVVDAATIAMDTMDVIIGSILEDGENTGLKTISKLNDDQKYEMIRKILSPYDTNLLVTPKEVDVIMEDISRIIADGINLSINNGMNIDEIGSYLS